jgi:hypothetical protein
MIFLIPLYNKLSNEQGIGVENHFLDLLHMRSITAHPCGLIKEKPTPCLIAFTLYRWIVEVKNEPTFCSKRFFCIIYS